MRTLALEMSGRIGSVALGDNGSIVAKNEFAHGLENAARVLPLIDSMTRDVGWKPHDFQRVAVSIGPGSFTGLRISVTIAKTLALAIGAKIIAVSSSHVLAMNAPDDAREIVIVLDAKRGQIFAARFEKVGNDFREIEPPHLDRLADVLSRANRPVHLIGEGVDFHRDSIDAADAKIIVTDRERWRARAEFVFEIGEATARKNLFADADRLTPLYIRLPEAEEKRLAAEAAQSRDHRK